MARLLPLAALLLVTGPAAAELPPQTEFINAQIAAKWKEADIQKPAARATDAEFLRRAFLDILGRIATPEEFTDFEIDPSRDKRAKLVRRLLHATDYKPRSLKPLKIGEKPASFNYADEYAKHWSRVWTNWLMGRTVDNRYREQMRLWLESEMESGSFNHKDMVTRLLTATGKTNVNGAVNFIAQQLGDTNPADRQERLGKFDAVPITSRVTRLFLGLQTQCTQCHDHPTNKEWVQSDFWGVNAFFRQVEMNGTPTRRADNNNMAMALAQVEITDNSEINPTGRIFYERRDGQLKSLKSTFLKDIAAADAGERSEKYLPESAKSRRDALADYVVGHDNFAKAYVNRVWGHFFGRGLNKDSPVDDFGSHNVVVHPELLKRLAVDIAGANYDPKQLMEWICLSEPYNLSHVAPAGANEKKYDPYFARMPLKALAPETLFESIRVATQFESATGRDEKARAAARDRWLSKLVAQFGDDEGNEINFNGTIVQALLMMNGSELNDAINKKGANAVLEVVRENSRGGATNADGVIDELFVMALNRHPTAGEKVKIKGLQRNGAILPSEAKKPGADVKPAAGKPRPQPGVGGVVMPTYAQDVTFYQDVFWALLNTSEFMLNH